MSFPRLSEVHSPLVQSAGPAGSRALLLTSGGQRKPSERRPRRSPRGHRARPLKPQRPPRPAHIRRLSISGKHPPPSHARKDEQHLRWWREASDRPWRCPRPGVQTQGPKEEIPLSSSETEWLLLAAPFPTR